MDKVLHGIAGLIIAVAIVTSGAGLFFTTGEGPYDFVNQYGDTVKMYGDGVYKNDSYFMAPIFRGTDCTVLFLSVPLLIIALILDIKHNTGKTKLFLTAIIAAFAYYSASISFGVTYNVLHLAYIALFSSSVYGLIIGFMALGKCAITVSAKIVTRGLKIFLALCGLSLFVAWLPDIVASLANKKSLDLIEVYTTQITYVLDMGIISPLMFICLYNLGKGNSMGYVLLGIVLTVLIIVGIMLPMQALFQIRAGITMPIQAVVTKIGIFVVLAIVAAYYEIRLFRNLA
jgi:hypothetical protein